MHPDTPHAESSSSASTQAAADLLQGLEVLREELGGVADELIALLRGAGITPPMH
ncbi:MAG: hypothetical protein ACYCZQ_07970 [Burkholderiales bacterium]